MPARSVFEYAVLRLVPRVERGEFLNVGVILFCRQRRFLDARYQLTRERLLALHTTLDVEALEEQLAHVPLVCGGGEGRWPIGELPTHERFRWLTAPRSSVLQPSPVHSGLCEDPQQALEQLFVKMVLGGVGTSSAACCARQEGAQPATPLQFGQDAVHHLVDGETRAAQVAVYKHTHHGVVAGADDLSQQGEIVGADDHLVGEARADVGRGERCRRGERREFCLNSCQIDGQFFAAGDHIDVQAVGADHTGELCAVHSLQSLVQNVGHAHGEAPVLSGTAKVKCMSLRRTLGTQYAASL
ncbi:DUF3037 domain-containing protein [Candidatus Gracilibacteria bacterium]|nr:DUF3037 domain-containing protein [Candidatus Gracilibacteria bacterium]